MVQRVTSFFIFFAIMVGPAFGQTVRDINAIPQDQVNTLEAAGVNLQAGDIASLIGNSLVGTSVTIRVVIMTDPLSSGLANLTDDINPDRIHVYVRDIAAAAMGNAGMGIQVVDGQYQTTGLINTTIGDVVDITGTVAPFGTSMQLAPETVTLLGSFGDFGLDATILDPVTVVSSDVNKSVDANGGVQPNWSNLADMSGQFVRLEGATLVARDISSDRPNWIVSSDGGTTVVSFYDMSLRYRNDRGSYPDSWNGLDDDFVPPPPGARINLQGFVVYQRDDPFNRGVPVREILSIVPFADSDLVVTETPPTVTNLSKPDFVPATSGLEISADGAADPSRTLSSVELIYTTSDNGAEQTVNGANTGGDTHIFPLPAQADGVFVTYWVRATDDTGASSVEMDPVGGTRFLANGITSVSHIQATADGLAGDSPFRNLTTDMDLMVTVMTQTSLSGLLSVQDATGPWSGVHIRGSSATDGLNRGDVIQITNAKIEERFGLTRLDDLTFTVTSTGGAGLPSTPVLPSELTSSDSRESFEGVWVTASNVVVGTPQADAPSDFGEFTLRAPSDSDGFRVDDQSSDFPGSFNDGLNPGRPFASASGLWSYSFSNYKLWPESTSDLVETAIGFSVRDINAIPQDQVSTLEAAGPGLDPGAIADLIGNSLVGTNVTIRVVVLSDPLSSGLANLTDGINPDRIHVYVRDVAAGAFGPEGMGIQVVDGQYQTTGLINTTIGDVVEITGTVEIGGNISWQLGRGRGLGI